METLMSGQIEVMINQCFGGFGFSPEAISKYRKANPEQNPNQIERRDPVMIQIVKEMGKRANGHHALIVIETIPEQYINHYSITSNDGFESVENPLRKVQNRYREIDPERRLIDRLGKARAHRCGVE